MIEGKEDTIFTLIHENYTYLTKKNEFGFSLYAFIRYNLFSIIIMLLVNRSVL